jgi:hypothetical protein
LKSFCSKGYTIHGQSQTKQERRWRIKKSAEIVSKVDDITIDVVNKQGLPFL